VGGVAAAHCNLVLALRRRGFEAHLFTFNDSASSPAPSWVVQSGSPEFLRRVVRFFCSLYLRLRTQRGALRYQLADILSSQFGAWLTGRKLRKFKPHAVILPDRGCPGLGVGPLPESAVLLVSHHNPARFAGPLIHGARTCPEDIACAVKLENKALRHVNAVVCPSEYMKECFERTYDFSGSVHIIPNLLDRAAFDAVTPKSPAKKLGLPEQTPVVYIPGGTSPVKGERFVFEIVRRIRQARPEAAFFVSGEPSDCFACELKTCNLEKYVFCPGRLAYHDNLAYAAGSDLCLSPAIAESFGMALLEAQYFGLPAVAFHTGGNREVVADGLSGYCAPFLDVDALVQKALFLLDPENEAVRQSMSRNAKERARAIAGDGAVDKYARVVMSLAEERKTSQCPRP
jgi:glycosyltransferase involved in cell wall biosynthesis